MFLSKNTPNYELPFITIFFIFTKVSGVESKFFVNIHSTKRAIDHKVKIICQFSINSHSWLFGNKDNFLFLQVFGITPLVFDNCDL